MGDRAQIAIKQPTKADPSARVYLYGHWIGDGIYQALQTVIKAGQRLDDPEYLTRIIAREMGMGEDGDTSYGIGNEVHSDIEHVVPVLDCEAQTITFEQPEWKHNKNPLAPAEFLTFREFADKDESFFDGW